YTFTFRILSFVRMLLENGFNVTEIYVDVFCPEDERNFIWIQEHFPEIVVSATNKPEMRFLHYGDEAAVSAEQANNVFDSIKEDDPINRSEVGRERCRILAVGQKAAYFAATDHFVNIAEGGGYYGYDGIRIIMDLMTEAFLEKKDRRELIQRKGYGCESCL
ncbi:MAG: hypothetical protein LUC41_03720, partial [Clostridiales bacterium]|nr:hypothetical protein [Clostridiales bacterium]